MKSTSSRSITRTACILLSALLLASCGHSSSPGRPASQDIQAGIYRVVLQLPGGDLPFGLDLQQSAAGWNGYLVNGPEHLQLDSVQVIGAHVEARMPGYENRLIADQAAGELRGEIILSKPQGRSQHLPLRAQFKQDFRFFPKTDSAALDVSGRWSVTFVADNGTSEEAVGEFTQSKGVVTGTFLTSGGDHRFLAGQVQGDWLYLSTFDGAHAFLYKAKIDQSAGTLTGDFWYGMAVHQRWSAQRNPDAVLPDAYAITTLRTGDQRFDFAFPDVDGHLVTSKDDRYRGKVLIIAIAGSWCPNCHDEAAFLAPLYKRERTQGLEVVSLMFENFGDFDSAAAATRRFRQQYGIEYATLIAGVSDIEEAGRKLPMLQKFNGFPTTVVVDRKGQVRTVHTGFSGPATGEHYRQFVSEFTGNLDKLLAESP